MHHSHPTAEKRRLAVFVFQNSDGECCLHFRDGSPNIVHPLQWSFFGGHVEPGENSRQAARRELEEETGVNADENDFDHVGILDYPDRTYEILKYRHPINWSDIRLQEGAGCGFFNNQELERLQNCSPLVEWLRTTMEK